MSIYLERRQLVMQIVSLLIKKKRKRSTHFKNLCEINRLSAACLVSSIRSGKPHPSPTARFAIPVQAWEHEQEKTLASTQPRLHILTEELKLGGIELFSKNTNLVAKLVQDTSFPNYLSYLPCSFSPQRFYYDKKYDASTSLYLDSRLLKGR